MARMPEHLEFLAGRTERQHHQRVGVGDLDAQDVGECPLADHPARADPCPLLVRVRQHRAEIAKPGVDVVGDVVGVTTLGVGHGSTIRRSGVTRTQSTAAPGVCQDPPMGDLAVDTATEQIGPNTFLCDLSPDWEIWGPNGGYLASVALRAAGIASGRARPASINAHFVGAGRSAPVEISVEINRETKVATSVTARISQEGRPLLVASVWGADDDLDGLEHHTTLGPHDLPGPDEFRASPSGSAIRLDRRATRSGATSSSARRSGSTTGRTERRRNRRRVPG